MYKKSTYLAIDPGITSGWCSFDDKGDMLEFGTFKYRDRNVMLKGLIHENLKAVIVEDYRNHAWTKQKNWSRNETSKLIGTIETFCEFNTVPVKLQPNTVKAIGYKWAGLKPAGNHANSHHLDAIAHGVYWLQQNNIRPIGRAQMKEKNNE